MYIVFLWYKRPTILRVQSMNLKRSISGPHLGYTLHRSVRHHTRPVPFHYFLLYSKGGGTQGVRLPPPLWIFPSPPASLTKFSPPLSYSLSSRLRHYAHSWLRHYAKTFTELRRNAKLYAWFSNYANKAWLRHYAHFFSLRHYTKIWGQFTHYARKKTNS